jgi:hypothetical protein
MLLGIPPICFDYRYLLHCDATVENNGVIRL